MFSDPPLLGIFSPDNGADVFWCVLFFLAIFVCFSIWCTFPCYLLYFGAKICNFPMCWIWELTFLFALFIDFSMVSSNRFFRGFSRCFGAVTQFFHGFNLIFPWLCDFWGRIPWSDSHLQPLWPVACIVTAVSPRLCQRPVLVKLQVELRDMLHVVRIYYHYICIIMHIYAVMVGYLLSGKKHV